MRRIIPHRRGRRGRLGQLEPVVVTATRLPERGASSMQPGETPAEYKERRLRELEAQGEPLQIEILEGQSTSSTWPGLWILGTVLALVWLDSRG